MGVRWFFCAGKPGGMPKGATRGAFRRAMTYSFGSISFGSLIVALINMLRQAVSIAQQQEAQSGNMVASIAFCILGCFIGLLDWAVQSVDTLYIHVPTSDRVSGSSIVMLSRILHYMAKLTSQLLKIRGRKYSKPPSLF